MYHSQSFQTDHKAGLCFQVELFAIIFVPHAPFHGFLCALKPRKKNSGEKNKEAQNNTSTFLLKSTRSDFNIVFRSKNFSRHTPFHYFHVMLLAAVLQQVLSSIIGRD